MEENKKSHEVLLKDLLLDADGLKRLDNWDDGIDLFDVLKITNMEIRHSNILAWLLDPNEKHGLGDAFIREFVALLLRKKDLPVELLLQDYFSYRVYRERNHMDIVLVSDQEKTVYIIENKIWSKESNGQLQKYVEKSNTEYAGYQQKVYAFLTPNEDDSSDPENWIPISYGEIVQVLEIATRDKNLTAEAQLIVENYKRNVRENIMKEKNEELANLCNEIYNKHRDALRLIFKYVNIDSTVESEIIRETLEKFRAEGKISIVEDNRWRFISPKMEEYLPHLEDGNSSWATKYICYYWFEKSTEKLIIHCEIGLMNLTEEAKEKTNNLIKVAGKKCDTDKFKRIYYKYESLSQKNYEESFEKAVEKLVTGALKEEEKWFQKLDAMREEPFPKEQEC